MRRALVLALPFLAGCLLAAPPEQPSSARAVEQNAFWMRLQSLCGKRFVGRLVEGNASDSTFARGPLAMEVRTCSPDEVRIPFRVGEDRSRTWVFTRTPTGLHLRHDHRAPDGTKEAPTDYGGHARVPGSAARQEFPADSLTIAMLPAAATNVWTIEVDPGRLFAYALRREATDRRFRVEFDLRGGTPLAER